MKKNFYKILSALIVLSVVLQSCKDNFETINTDPINTPNALPQQLLAPALVGTVTANALRNRNFNNELMQVTVSLSDGDASVFRYEFRNTISNYLWDSWYLQLTNFKDLYTQASNPITLNRSYQGISLICQSWIYSMLTDTYGDVPYFQSNLARDGIIEPAFDKQKDIYLDIFKKLEEANTLLSSNTAITASSDPVFNGNVGRWRRFGNSLYLRLLLRVSGKSEVSSEVIAKIKEMVNEKASSYPIMTSNDDSAVLRWTGVGPYTSPYVNNVRDQDFRGPAIGDFFIRHLRDWNDPRINIPVYGKGGVNRLGIAQGSNGFAGVASGYVPGTGEAKQSYFYSRDQQQTSLQNDPMTGIIMTYSELQFILSEAALKGWITGSAKTYWETGVLNGITFWLPMWPNPTAAGTPPATPATIASPEFREYLTSADLDWDESLSEEEKMEKIHLQKYYAMFLTDLQQWFEYRRTGHPVLPKGPGLRNGGVMPARMVYPVYVQSANPTNYQLAVAAQGSDAISTPVWWQKQ
ncbi:SusD/RagB family nutrient-binding outer membrane lipoprotein [Pedobacter sp. SYSU D00535]|uniref:SusD/RagB family nutrient-binding outer membrane lipoprotein n=1 Tax=Pedobacter sp. SYSU D00535 TaxID=2810308 RepID=UPI001A976F76|nr:SusD/RagB family nutrient-binding outer membrane lipoprotein [Pedobacter sp. SYSU D00535]